MAKKHFFIFGFIFALFALVITYAQDNPDLVTVAKIRHEGFKHSQVMKIAGYISDVIGPRPMGSPEVTRAYNWTADKFKEWGCKNVNLEPFEFGVGWAPRYVSAHLLAPHYAPLIAISVEWGSSTNGKITGQPVCVDIKNKEDFEKYQGKLKGKIVLYEPPREIPTSFTPDARRYDKTDLDARAVFPVSVEARDWQDYKRSFVEDLEDFFRSEGIGVLVRPSPSRTRDYGTRIHHTNMDVYDHLIPEDLMQSAVIMASFVYNTAIREEMFPREPLCDPFKYPVRR